MPKKTTLRFYNSSDKYVEWKYLSDITYFEILNWIKSGNYILVKDQRIDASSKSTAIFALLRRKN